MYLLFLAQVLALPSSWQDGYVTYYGGQPSGGGACGYPGEVTSSFPFGMYAAADFTLFDNNKDCGACYEIQCTGPFTQAGANNCQCASKTVTIQVDNSCCNREYNTPHFDLNPAAMNAILDNDIGTCGVAAVKFRQVDCAYNAEGKNVKLVAKPGTSVYWYAFFVWDVAGTGQIQKARIRSSGSNTWVDCPLSGAYYQCNGGTPYSPPLTVELTDIIGEVLVGTSVITDTTANAEWDFGTNFGKTNTPATQAPSAVTTQAPVLPPPSTSAPGVPSTRAPTGSTTAPQGSTTTPQGTTAAPQGTPSPGGGGNGVSAGIWVLIAVCILVFIVAVVAVIVYMLKKKREKDRVNLNSFVESIQTKENGQEMRGAPYI
eukprot:TRINITY_DN20963_c0_g2_i2.p1 TRINITY_DN20963_c0_g2~~TRINITY_DN20963_c0_g2_i2.p1  ORF type:complete len:381 (+),score=61.47 TRINITY_DN20963_c0_g2_i2:26-1144(+)